MGFPGSSAGKESACNAGNPGSILGWEDPLEKEMKPTPVFSLGNPMDRGVWWALFMESQRVGHD